MPKRNKIARLHLEYAASQARPDLGESWLKATAFSELSETLEPCDSIHALIRQVMTDFCIQRIFIIFKVYLMSCYYVPHGAYVLMWGDEEAEK